MPFAPYQMTSRPTSTPLTSLSPLPSVTPRLSPNPKPAISILGRLKVAKAPSVVTYLIPPVFTPGINTMQLL